MTETVSPYNEHLEIATIIPTYAGCPDLPRCLHYIRLAEDYVTRYEPGWRVFHHVFYGEKFGDGRVWSAERDREIARCRDESLRWGAANSKDWVVTVDADTLVPENFYVRMGSVLPDVEAKCAPTFNAETGTYRFVGKDYHAIWQVPRPPIVDRTSENLMVRSSVVNRLPKPYYRMDKLNEDYELCDVLAGLGVKIWVVSGCETVST